MFTIHSYTDTKCELEMAKTRLNLLMDKKEKMYCKYFPLTSKPKEVMADGGERNNDKMSDYLHELHEIDIGTGKSLADEITYQQENVNKLQNYLNDMADTLSKMAGLEYQLYYEIIVKGIKISKAVTNIAELNNLETRTIWRTYNQIKKDVKKVINFAKCQ